MMHQSHELCVEVVYATPQVLFRIQVDCQDPCTVEQVVQMSGLVEQLKGQGLPCTIDAWQYSIFGSLVSAEQLVCHGDRVEVCRPLLVDPKEQRRRRVNGHTRSPV